MQNSERVMKITEILENQFKPSFIDVIDDSEAHIGHAGAESGKGHFELIIQSDYFEGMTLIKAHRAIYQALGDLMQTDIHALQIHIKK